MPTRAIKLKLVLPRKSGGHTQALWVTHSVVNEAVARYIQTLLLMRGESYYTEEQAHLAEDVRTQALELAREVQRRNGIVARSDDEVLALLLSLYEEIIPAARQEEGSAQDAAAWLYPLATEGSKAFLSSAEILSRPEPVWVARLDADPEAAQAEAQAWLEDKGALVWRLESGTRRSSSSRKSRSPRASVLTCRDLARRCMSVHSSSAWMMNSPGRRRPRNAERSYKSCAAYGVRSAGTDLFAIWRSWEA